MSRDTTFCKKKFADERGVVGEAAAKPTIEVRTFLADPEELSQAHSTFKALLSS